VENGVEGVWIGNVGCVSSGGRGLKGKLKSGGGQEMCGRGGFIGMGPFGGWRSKDHHRGGGKRMIVEGFCGRSLVIAEKVIRLN